MSGARRGKKIWPLGVLPIVLLIALGCPIKVIEGNADELGCREPAGLVGLTPEGVP